MEENKLIENGKKSNVKKIVIGLILLVLAGGFIAFTVFNNTQVAAEETGGIARNALPVHWAYPEMQTIISQVNARGTVEFVDRHIIFPETQARITNVHVSVGDVVEVGDLLITYDDSVLDNLNDSLAQANLALRQAQLGLQAAQIAPTSAELLAAETQVEQARANIASTEAQLTQIDLQISQIEENIQTARVTQTDVQSLFESGVASRVELDNASDAVRRLEDQLAITASQRDAAALGLPLAEESVRLAQAQQDVLRNRNNQPGAVNQAQIQQVNIEQARLNIDQIQRSIDEFEQEERATVAGTILSVLVNEGEFSAAGRPLMEIADTSSNNLVVVVHVPENDAGNVALGQEVEISGGALGNRAYTGTISLIHPVAAPRQIGNTVETVITVEITPESGTHLQAGITVDADIVTNVLEDTLVVPLMSTLSAGGGLNFVFVIDEDSNLQRRDIVLGEFSNMYIEAIGIQENDMVIASPTHIMYEGMQVRPLGVVSE